MTSYSDLKLQKTAPVTVVVPMLNEENFISELLHALDRQTLQPYEIIFVDGGSTDLTVEKVEYWIKNHKNTTEVKIVVSKGSKPGFGRNLGVKLSCCPLIAFIDAGITPSDGWLSSLYYHYLNSGVVGIFGTCKFYANTNFQRAVCAVSYGYASKCPVIPASLFHKSVFNEIGYFAENLLAGEDLLWVSKFINRYGWRENSKSAEVEYTHFPVNIKSVWRKWRLSEKNCATGHVRDFQNLVYILVLSIILTSSFINLGFFCVWIVIYLVIRGIYDPIRRSGHKFWWGKKISLLWLALLLVIVMDVAKVVGIAQAWIETLLHSKDNNAIF